MKRIKPIILCITLMIALHATAQYKIEVLDTNTFLLGEGVILNKTSFRGLSVVDDQTIWVSGSRGTIARSIDGGKTFTYNQLKGYEKSDFRDIEAFDDKRAIIMSSGTPAYILKTIDNGQTWKEVYKNTDTAYFLDAMDFWDDQRGILVGDPINGHFLLMQTNDGGETWQELDTTKTPKAMEGEAVFAASGTSLRCWDENEYGFVSGGLTSKFYYGFFPEGCTSMGKTNLKSGLPSTGGYSFVYWYRDRDDIREDIIVVGGDYKEDTKIDSNSSRFYYERHSNSCEVDRYFKTGFAMDVKGYRSCIEMIGNGKRFIACGTSGVDLGIKSWKTISNESFHVVRKAKKGKAVFLAGPRGKIGKLIY